MKEFFTKTYFLENKEKMIKLIIVAAIIVVALFVFLFKTGSKDEIVLEKQENTVSAKETKAPAPVIADVSGAVNSPMVVELKEGSRIGDAIDAAGGLGENADITNINRAAIVNDGDKIYIPIKGEVIPEGTPGQENGTSKININTATASELQKVNGIGPVTAEKILLYRTSNGSFNQLEDLKKVDGIGDKTYEKMKDQITI